ncbi:hypothetical protein LPJ61_001683 [Coemansia biformis]|uniref:Uncharacterized protein n=1 Tax=Coemansia biformis TaxID=1286918 RepID=A0A9W8CZV0_9FUNG|nr:hypothetical protein LPJ61_001683 [Coemansia biformis]
MAAAPVNYQDAESTPLIALWLSMWQQSLTHPVDADAAAASLAGFGRLMADTSPAQPMDMLTGDPAGQGDRAAEMANSLLAHMLTQGDTRAALLPVVASLLAGGAFVVSPTVCALFVDAYPACLAAWPARDIKPLLSVPKRLAAASAGSVDVALVLAALARDTIPILAKKIYARPDSAQPEGAAAADGDALAALVQFATAEYGAAASSGPATAAVLMVLLSMLPEDGPLSPREAPVTEAILTLAAARPLAFRDIVIRLSAAHKSAKLRLELAIRSHAPPEVTADTMRAPAGGARRAEARDSTGIVLKSDFGI